MLREAGLLPAQQFLTLSPRPRFKSTFTAMKRRDRIASFGALAVSVEDYSLKMLDLANEWGVELSAELRDSLAEI